MTPDEFYEKFELFSEAPDAVGKMRELVLWFAISGRLVPQKPNEEKATEQLSRISEIRKAKATKAKKTNASTHSDLAKQSEAPLPAGWAEVPLEALLTVINGRAYKKAELLDSGTPVLRVGNLFTSSHWYYSNLQLEPDKYCDEGDLIYAWSASFGPFIWSGPRAIYHYHIWKLELHSEEEISKRFLYWFLEAKTQEIKSAGRGLAMLHMTKGRMEKLNVPLPPLAEQKRIVAKVDELMALCDELETRQAEREQQKAAIHRAALHRFHQSPAPGNLNLLFREEWSAMPADIRKSIFTLAIRGKLVPQDSEDGSATELINQISNVKESLSATKTSRSVSPPKTSQEIQADFEIPDTWEWVRFGEITFNRDGERVPVSRSDRESREKIYDYYGASGVIDKIDDYLFDKPLLLIGEDGANLINRSTPIAFIARGKYWVNNHAHVLDGISEEFLQFIELHINAIDLKPYVTGTAQPKMNQAKLNSIPIALPPLAEQKRIVAKVDHLMALVDELEAQQTRSDTLARDLLDALVAELTAARAPEPVLPMT